MTVTIYDEEFVQHTCLTCGVKYYIGSEHDRGLKNCKNNFYCPNGHAQNYIRSTAEVLQEELDQKIARIADLERARAHEAARAIQAELALNKIQSRKKKVKK